MTKFIIVFTTHAKKIEEGTTVQVQDMLTTEEILNISVNGEAYTMTMRSPGNEEALVRGILLSEDVYDDREKDPLFIVTETNDKDFITRVNMIVPAAKLKGGIDTKRNLVSVSSCGMCGKSEMELALEGEKIKAAHPLHSEIVSKMFVEMREQQQTFSKSGGSHASAAFSIDGELLACHEDIGRHNAVDKVIGQLLLDRKLVDAAVLLVSGRVSYEIVSKCFRARIPYLAAVSAPSSMAVEYCDKTGITLLAFCRENKCTVYTNFANVL